jgi:hypothetical protein
LKVSRVDVEAENLRSERMLCRELFGAPDALLPGSVSHRAIMGLRHAAGNLVAGTRLVA